MVLSVLGDSFGGVEKQTAFNLLATVAVDRNV